MPLQETSGAASYDAFGGGPAAVRNYIEDVFSTWLYSGTGSAQTIVNGIDLAGEGGLVWIKNRGAATNNLLFDTPRGTGTLLSSNLATSATAYTGFGSFNSNGFSLNVDPGSAINASSNTYASWTFRKQPKFFDVVTYTGTGSNRTIAHNLGSVPGCIIVKRTDTTGDWQVYHRSLANTEYMVLNSTAAKATGATRWNSTTPTSTVFSLGTVSTVNASGGTYVAYLFAHDAGGFGLEGTDNVISCGSYTSSTGSTSIPVTLGFEPQWILVKATGSGSGTNWNMFDVMRGWPVGANGQSFRANTTAAEAAEIWFDPTATGFIVRPGPNAEYNESGGRQYIYIAIRRGPMKVPTSGTSVFGLSARTGTGANATVTGSAGVSDAVLVKNRGSAVASLFSSRLTGTGYLVTSSTAAEVDAGTTILQANPWDVMDGVKVGTTSTITNASGNTFINYLFDRAPGFFDVVCYTGTGSYPFTVNHNLGVVPELIIFKKRSAIENWWVYAQPITSPNANWYQNYLILNTTGQRASDTTSITTAPTSSAITIANFLAASTQTYVVYLFATVAGVSKVGSYTGTGTTKQIDCGFTAGARFVMIKRTDSTGDWYVWDSARGIVAGNDPYLLLNSTAAEVTSTDYIDTYSAGFEISSTAPVAINANGGTYLFLAIA